MPTVSWILESDLDRFFEATTTAPSPKSAPPPPDRCPFCFASFADLGALGRHLGIRHVGARPFILLNGTEPSQTEVVRQQLAAPNISVLNATDVGVSDDGITYKPTAIRDLSVILSGLADHRIWLRISNRFEAKAAPVHTDYELQFRAYSGEQLTAVDQQFVQHLARSNPTVTEVDRFLQRARLIGANEYADALGDYVLAVLIKDNDRTAGVRPAERDHRRKFNSALRILQDFDRPVANLVSALIRFSSNDFSVIKRTGFEPLDSANLILAALAGMHPAGAAWSDGMGRQETQRVGLCPVDNGSDAVMRRADQLSSLSRWSSDVEDGVRVEANLASLDPLDRVKLLALWAGAAMRLEKLDSAAEPLRLLIGNDCFGSWAEKILEERYA